MEPEEFFLRAINAGSKIERLQQETIIFWTFILNIILNVTAHAAFIFLPELE